MSIEFGSTRKVAMQAVSVKIDVKPFDIPTLVCSDHSEDHPDAGYVRVVAKAVADALGLEEFLSKPGRVDELRRRLWEQDPVF